MPPLAVSVTLSPVQIFGAAGVIDGTGSRFTLTVLEAEAVQPFPSVTVTLYVVVDVGETEIEEAFDPVLHEYEVPLLAVSVALAPMQMLTVAGEITADGFGLTVTVLEAVAVHPFASVTVTVYVVVVEGETVISFVKTPVLHE